MDVKVKILLTHRNFSMVFAAVFPGWNFSLN